MKVHVHTNDPGLAIQKALTYGSLSRMKIDNMREEHHERLIQNAEKLAKEQKDQEEREKAEQAKASESRASRQDSLQFLLEKDSVRSFAELEQTISLRVVRR